MQKRLETTPEDLFEIQNKPEQSVPKETVSPKQKENIKTDVLKTNKQVKVNMGQSDDRDLPIPEKHKSEILQRVEEVLEDDLDEVFQKMTPEQKKKFKEEGEEAAEEIEGLLHRVKLKAQRVFKIIFHWLKHIPGVNKYFLQQEAKLKTDEIMEIKEEMEGHKQS